MIFDKQKFIASLESSSLFITVYTTFFVIILCNIWFPYTLQNRLNDIESSEKPISTSSSGVKTIYGSSSPQTSTVSPSSTTYTPINTISLLKKDIYQSVSHIESVALVQANAYINSTIYFLNTTCSKNGNFTKEQFSIITREINNVLEKKSEVVNQVIQKLNDSSVSVELGADNDGNTSLNQTDLNNLKINPTEFESYLTTKENAFDDWFSINNLVNLTKFEIFMNTSNKYNLSLNDTQSSTLDLLLAGYFTKNTNFKRDYTSNDNTPLRENDKKRVTTLTIVFSFVYTIGIILYLVTIFLMKEKIQAAIIESQSVTSTSDPKPTHYKLVTYGVYFFTFLINNMILIIFWIMLITEYCFLKYHTHLSFNSENLSKRSHRFAKRSNASEFSTTLNNNIETFVTFNLFDSQKGIISTYVDELGIVAEDLQNNILSTLRQTVSTSYDTSIAFEDLPNTSVSHLTKRHSSKSNSETQQFFTTIKNIILKYIRILIIFVSIFIIVQLFAHELCKYHS